MDFGRIRSALTRLFVEENQRIVFWNDPGQEFLDHVNEIVEDNVILIRADQEPALQIKYKLEIEDPEGLYLIYEPKEEPNFEDDWLLDIRLYSRPFRADRASMLISELGLADQHLRTHIDRRRKFFDNKDRIDRLKSFMHADDGADELDLKMLAVIVRADQPEPFLIIRTLFHTYIKDGIVDLNAPPRVWGEIEKHGLETSFWNIAKDKFGYSDSDQSLKGLLIRLFVSELISRTRIATPPALQKFELPRSGANNAAVCLAQWRDSANHALSYNAIADQLGENLNIEGLLVDIPLDRLIAAETFQQFEKLIVRKMIDLVRSTMDTINLEQIRNIANRRKDCHWLRSPSVIDTKRKNRIAAYDALVFASCLFDLKNQNLGSFNFNSDREIYQGYEKNLFRFDQYYRLFCENADVLERESMDLLKQLRADVEDLYCNWYLNNIQLRWGTYVSGGLLNTWQIDGVKNQYSFYNENVQRNLDKADRKRIFVIISDALRYEVAEELCNDLNSKYRLQANISSMLGVLPSYTSLGMACLLPHRQVEYNAVGEVLVDGMPTGSLEQRSSVLSRVGGMAIKSDELISLSQQDGRALIKESKVVYIYHNQIDARGDKAVTENDTFAACRDAIGDISSLAKYIVNNLNGNHIFITADHGFIFSESGPSESDRSRLNEKPGGTIEAKKRYLIGRGLPQIEGAWHGTTATSAKASGDVEFWIPKGNSRFHFVGGAKFVHGGAMLQEIVVPLIEVRHIKDESQKERTRVREVGVQVLGTRHKITTQKHRFTLMQTDPISDRLRPAIVKLGIYEGDQLISDLISLTFDSPSDNLDDRQKQVLITLQDREYNKTKTYNLIVRDMDGIEILKIDLIIDRIITDDF